MTIVASGAVHGARRAPAPAGATARSGWGRHLEGRHAVTGPGDGGTKWSAPEARQVDVKAPGPAVDLHAPLAQQARYLGHVAALLIEERHQLLAQPAGLASRSTERRLATAHRLGQMGGLDRAVAAQRQCRGEREFQLANVERPRMVEQRARGVGLQPQALASI